jgi:hypothetical protein
LPAQAPNARHARKQERRIIIALLLVIVAISKSLLLLLSVVLLAPVIGEVSSSSCTCSKQNRHLAPYSPASWPERI